MFEVNALSLRIQCFPLSSVALHTAWCRLFLTWKECKNDELGVVFRFGSPESVGESLRYQNLAHINE